MKRLLRLFLPIAVLGGCVAVSLYLIKSAPEPKRRPPRQVIPVVEAMKIKPGDYTVKVESRGTVMPRTQSVLVSEIAGRIVEVSPNFRNGEFFGSNELLLRVDPAEYHLAVANIEAAMQGVEAKLAELAVSERNIGKSLDIEKQHMALADKQYRRHKELFSDGTVSKSVMEQSEREYLSRRASLQSLENSLRLIPTQRRSQEADLKLKLTQRSAAQLNLARTRIHAPYAGRALEKQVDLGQSVSKGSVLGSIYAVDFMEVRLPITDSQAAFLDLAETFRSKTNPISGPEVILSADIGPERNQWKGRIIRSEGTIDTRTRQLFVVAEVEHPYALVSHKQPLKVGQFVEAEIRGRVLKNVFIIPRKALRANDEVMLITSGSQIRRGKVEVVWRDKESAVVVSGLKAGDLISLTPLPYAPDGAPVKINGGNKLKM